MQRAVVAIVAATCVVLAVNARTASADAVITVRWGENLNQIAARHGSSVHAIVRANGLASADLVYAGQRLTVPTGTLAPSSVAGASTHVVRPGETLLAVAAHYGTTVPALTRANGLASPDRIYIGQRLSVPGASGGRGVGGAAPVPNLGSAPGRRLVVDLSAQTLTAVESGVAVRTFYVSTGKPGTPTPVGTFRIYNRLRSQHMVGPGYSLPGVPYVQYFTGAYALHGAYWHASFGAPVSHGCINMRPVDAAWVWDWTRNGTPVSVQH